MKYILRGLNSKMILLLIVFGLHSCDDYLEVVPKDQVSDLTVWQKTENADLFLSGIYNAIPDYFNAFDPTENYSDDTMDGINATISRTVYANSVYTPSNAPTRWGIYATVRSCNLFIEKATASSLPDDWKKRSIAEARFLRAYYYSLLWTYYGGVPVITNVLNQSEQGEAIFRPRNSSDETVKFITEECAAIAPDLPIIALQKGRATRGAALTLKGSVELYDASLLHNPTNDKSKWAKAAATNKQVMDMKVYDLFPNYETQFYEENNYNIETIFARAYLGGTTLGSSREGVQGPLNVKGAQVSYGMINPTQELVDDYFMANGLPISDPASGYDPQNPYANREKRFYQSIVYDGSIWKDDMMIMKQGLGSPNQMDLTGSGSATKTGYYLRKGLNHKYTVNGNNRLNSANCIIFRYAEVLLNYAEAQNEAVGPDASVYTAVNKVRSRSELPALKAGFNQDQMRAALRQERRIELAFEEKRWNDLIRWKIAEVKLNVPLKGMRIAKVGNNWVYTVIPAAGGGRTFFANRNYYLPIPQSAINQNSKLIQNPNY